MADSTGNYFVQPEEIGSVKIAEEVVTTIAANAVSEVKGVAGLATPLQEGLAGILGRRFVSGGVKITNDEDGVVLDILLRVRYGYVIPELCRDVQKKVSEAVESMTGLKVRAVNVNVSGVSFEPEQKPEPKPDQTAPAPASITDLFGGKGSVEDILSIKDDETPEEEEVAEIKDEDISPKPEAGEGE